MGWEYKQNPKKDYFDQIMDILDDVKNIKNNKNKNIIFNTFFKTFYRMICLIDRI